MPNYRTEWGPGHHVRVRKGAEGEARRLSLNGEVGRIVAIKIIVTESYTDDVIYMVRLPIAGSSIEIPLRFHDLEPV